MYAEHLSVWASDEEVISFLADAEAVTLFVKALAEATMGVGMHAQQLSCRNGPVFFVPCLGCNTPYDADGGCQHTSSLQTRECRSVQVQKFAHRSVLLMTLATSLLNCDASRDALMSLLVLENPPNVSPGDFMMSRITSGQSTLLMSLVGVVDNCARALPNCAHAACSLLSLIVACRPAASLSMLDPESLVDAVYRYVADVFTRVNNAECVVEERFGLVQLLNLAPLLYFLGDWRESAALLSEHALPVCLASIVCNVLHSAAAADDPDRGVDGGENNHCDRPADLEQFPELHKAHVDVASLYGGAPELWQRPMSAVVASLLEVLGRWAWRGVRVSTGRIPSRPPDDVAARLSATERLRYSEPISDCFAEYRPRLGALCVRTPRISFATAVLDAIVDGRRPHLPTGGGLLRDPLMHVSMSCALPECGRAATPDGEPLMLCSGRCSGLARYCCGEHQRAHWSQHKFFCRRQGPSSSSTPPSSTRRRTPE